MKNGRKIVRDHIRAAAPACAVPMVRRFRLTPEEEVCLIECDVMGRTLVSVGFELHVSPETVSRRRRSALGKIAAALA